MFKKLCKKANVTHIRHTYYMSPQTEDGQIYNLATSEDRIIITQDEGFKFRAKNKGAGVFIIPPYLNNDEIDRLLTAFISNKNPDVFKSKATKI